VGGGIEFPHGLTVWRDRRATTASPYNPARPAGDWDPELTIPLEQAFVSSSSATSRATATRQQIAEEKSLFLATPQDVARGDRIRVGGTLEAGGDVYFVNLRPTADTNPWTGDVLVQEIPLDYTEG
jgi:hypothetical protein